MIERHLCEYCGRLVIRERHDVATCAERLYLSNATKRVLRLFAPLLGVLLGCSSSPFTLDPTADPTDTPAASDTSDPSDATPLADSGQTPSDGPQDGPWDGKTEVYTTDSGVDTRPDLDTATETSEVCTGKPLGEDCMIAEPKSCCSGKCVSAGGCCGIGKCVL